MQKRQKCLTEEEAAHISEEKQTLYNMQCEKIEKIIEASEQDEYLKLSVVFSLYVFIQTTIFLFLGVWEMIKGVFKREK